MHSLALISLSPPSGPPLLSDVLQSALNIGGGAKMVVEIKPGNAEMGAALCELFR